jgi:hypothetical protein
VELPSSSGLHSKRQGEWTQLSYGHYIGYGARRLACIAVAKELTEFQGHCKLLLDAPEYAEAVDLIAQRVRVLEHGYEDLLPKVQLAPQSMFRNEFQSDPSIWPSCIDEWRAGPGFKERVTHCNREWFDDERRRRIEKQLLSLVAREREMALESVSARLDSSVVHPTLGSRSMRPREHSGPVAHNVAAARLS